QRIRLTNTRHTELSQDSVRGLPQRFRLAQPVDKHAQRASRVVLPCRRKRLRRHASDLSEQGKLVAPGLDFLANALHRQRHRRATSLSINTNRRHGSREAKHVTLGETSLLPRTSETHRQRDNL